MRSRTGSPGHQEESSLFPEAGEVRAGTSEDSTAVSDGLEQVTGGAARLH